MRTFFYLQKLIYRNADRTKTIKKNLCKSTTSAKSVFLFLTTFICNYFWFCAKKNMNGRVKK